MKKFTNQNVKKEHNKMKKHLIIGIVLLLIAIGFAAYHRQEVQKANQNIMDLNSIIIGKDQEKDYKKAYLNAQSVPYQFAVYDDTKDSYYIVLDSQYMYIVYMSPSDFNKLNKEEIKEKPIRIEGITKTPTKDVKQLAINAYNQGLEESEKLSLADFNNYFGEVYLDMTATNATLSEFPFLLSILFLIFGIIMAGIGMVELINFSKKISKMTAHEIDELDKEMNDKDAFYYDKANLYLTNNYVITFAGTLRAIAYKDILWMYPFEQRTNGIKTSQSIRILTSEAKTYTVANVDLVTKRKKEIYNEIWETIKSKNPQIKTGYTKENIKEMKSKIKEIKQQKTP